MTAIFPLRGLPPFIFGMNRSEVRAAAGEPDSIQPIDSEFTGAAERWCYLDRQVQVSFGEDEQWRLEAIDVDDVKATIEGIELLGIQATDLAQLAALAGVSDVQMTDDCGEFGCCYESVSKGLLFWEVEGLIVNFTMFPECDEAGEVILWPETQ